MFPCLVGAKNARRLLQNLDRKCVLLQLKKEGHLCEETSLSSINVDTAIDISPFLQRAFEAQSPSEELSQ